jgi:hypothetical protein
MAPSKEDEMQGDIVTAARWLGGSILLASGIMVGGLRWGERPLVPTPATPVVTGKPAPLDPEVHRQSAEAAIDEEPAAQSRVTACRPTGQRTPIFDPIAGESAPASCLDPPSEEEVWDKVAESRTSSPVFYETQRNNVRIQIEKIGEKVDPCKVYPLAGPCQLVHCHYKCSVSFDETSWSDPVPIKHLKRRVEFVFIDKDHLRRCGRPEDSNATP